MTVRKKNRQEYERDSFRAQFTAVDRYLTEPEREWGKSDYSGNKAKASGRTSELCHKVKSTKEENKFVNS